MPAKLLLVKAYILALTVALFIFGWALIARSEAREVIAPSSTRQAAAAPGLAGLPGLPDLPPLPAMPSVRTRTS